MVARFWFLNSGACKIVNNGEEVMPSNTYFLLFRLSNQVLETIFSFLLFFNIVKQG